MDPTQVKTKLIGYGFSLLEGIDPNPDNYVCAGIIHTKTIQIGCLLRLEPNQSANVSVLNIICNVLVESHIIAHFRPEAWHSLGCRCS